jgi:hypothetical protein
MLTKRDKKKLQEFARRPSMETGNHKMQGIISFVHGYECALGNRYFTKRIAKLLDKKYQVKKDAYGWNGQVLRYARKKKIRFSEAFRQLCDEALS